MAQHKDTHCGKQAAVRVSRRHEKINKNDDAHGVNYSCQDEQVSDLITNARDVGGIRGRWDHGRLGRPCRLGASQTTKLLADLAAA